MKARVHGKQLVQATDQKGARHQENHGEGELHSYEGLLKSRQAPGSTPPPTTQRLPGPVHSEVKGWCQPEQHACKDAQRYGKKENGPVHRDQVQARKYRSEGEEEAGTGIGHPNPQKTSTHPQEHTFGQQLPDEPAPTGPQCGPGGHLMAASCGFPQEESGHVPGCDEKQNQGGAQQEGQR